MITCEQALRCNYFHADGCTRVVGPRGGVVEKIEVWRRNGATKTWKKRPGEFRIPVKHGLYRYGYITQSDAVHAEEDCQARPFASFSEPMEASSH